MNITKLTKILYLHELIAKKATGSPKQLAEKLGVCERTAYKHVEALREMGAPISYSFAAESYCYEKDWKPSVIDYLWQKR